MKSDLEFVLASRPDLTPGQIEILRRKTPREAAALLELLPAAPATRGAVRASRSGAKESADIAERFGRRVEAPTIHWEGNSLYLPQITREQARAVIASRMKEGPLPRGAELSNTDVMRMAMTAKGQAHS